MDIRGLLYQVTDNRDDILGRRALMCLQNAARRVCEETYLVQDIRSVQLNTATDGFAQEKRIAILPAAIAGLKLQDGVTADTTPYRVVRILGVTLHDAAAPSAVNKPLEAKAPDLLRYAQQTYAPGAGASVTYWADQIGLLLLYPAPTAEWDSVTVKVCLSPMGNDFESVALPEGAREAVIQGALAEAFALAGEHMNQDLALHHKKTFLSLLGDLKWRNQIGGAGGADARQPNDFNFTTR